MALVLWSNACAVVLADGRRAGVCVGRLADELEAGVRAGRSGGPGPADCGKEVNLGRGGSPGKIEPRCGHRGSSDVILVAEDTRFELVRA